MPSPSSIVERARAAAYLVNDALGIGCVIVEDGFHPTLELPPNHLETCFCHQVQTLTNSIEDATIHCEDFLYSGTGESTFSVHNCPHGLVNIIVPVPQNDSSIGALRIGPMIMESPDELLMKHGVLSLGIEVDKIEELKTYLESLPRGNVSYITSIARLVNSLVSDENLVFESLNPEQAPSRTSVSSETDARVASAVQRFVNENFTNNEISLNMVASHVFVHPSYVSRIFSRQLNCRFRSYINDLRVNLAEELLAETNKSVGDICHEVGFSDHSYFNKVFKQMCGLTPSEFRTQIKSERHRDGYFHAAPISA